MNAFEAITAEILEINAESDRIAKAEGFTYAWSCTGKVLIDPVNEVVWYQMADEYNTTTWATLGYPENAAFEEKVVVVDSEAECLSYADDYNL
jgi:translation elongation factor EF-Ts